MKPSLNKTIALILFIGVVLARISSLLLFLIVWNLALNIAYRDAGDMGAGYGVLTAFAFSSLLNVLVLVPITIFLLLKVSAYFLNKNFKKELSRKQRRTIGVVGLLTFIDQIILAIIVILYAGSYIFRF